MRRSFQRIQQLLNVVVTETARQPQFSRGDHEGLSGWSLRKHQSETQKVIDHLFERGTRPSALLIQETRYIVIERKSGSHIMMLTNEAS